MVNESLENMVPPSGLQSSWNGGKMENFKKFVKDGGKIENFRGLCIGLEFEKELFEESTVALDRASYLATIKGIKVLWNVSSESPALCVLKSKNLCLGYNW